MKVWSAVAIFLVVLSLALVVLIGDEETVDGVQDGLIAFKKGDYTVAVRLLRPYSASGNPKAMRLMGMAYALGLGVDPDSEEAKRLLKSGSTDPAAEYYAIAKEFADGQMVEKSERSALVWYLEAANSGSETAAIFLSDVYRSGKMGEPIDEVKAEYWQNQAIAQ